MIQKKFDIIKALLAVLIFCLLATIVQGILKNHLNRQESTLHYNWTVQINDKVYEDVNLSQFEFENLKRGDNISLSRQIDNVSEKYDMIRMRAQYSVVRVFADEKQVYEIGEKYYRDNKVLGNGYCFINIPDNQKTVNLKIEIIPAENNAFSQMDDVTLMNSEHMYKWLFIKNLVTAEISAFCIIFAVLLCIGAIVSIHKKNICIPLFWLSSFAVETAIWMVCNMKLVQLFTMNLHRICVLEYAMMYLAFVTFLLGLFLYVKDKKFKKNLSFIVLGVLLFETVLYSLNATNYIHFPKSLFVYQSIAILILIYIFIMLTKMFKKSKRQDEVIFLLGVFIITGGGAFEMLRYMLNKYILSNHHILQTYIPVVILLFVVSIFGSYLYKILEIMSENAERQLLYSIAYTDSLTNIKSRAWCERVMNEYNDEKKPVTIINMDLNKFKQVNDNLGHTKGDEYLQKFAYFLSQVFEKEGCVGRMGGDEFIVILDAINQEKTDYLIGELSKKVEQENEKGINAFTISFSYGYASDSAADIQNVWQIYKEADANMYQNKRMYHSEK